MSGVHIDDVEAAEDWPLLGQFLAHAAPHARYLVVALLAIVLQQVLSTSVPTIIGLAFDGVFNDNPFGLPVVPDAWIPTSPDGQLWVTVVLLGIVFAVQAPAAYAASYLRSVFSYRLKFDLRMDTYATVQELQLSFFDHQQTGEILSILNNDVDQLDSFFDSGIADTVQHGAALGAMLGFMLLLNWQLTLVVFVLAPVFVVVTRHFWDRIGRIHSEAQQAFGRLNARFEDNINGMAVIKASTTEPFESGRVADASTETFRAYWRSIKIRNQFGPATWAVSQTTYFLVFIVGGYWVIGGAPGPLSGTLTAGQLIPFLLYTRRIRGRLNQLFGQVETFQSARASAERVSRLQREDLAIEERPDAHELDDVTGRVEAADVTFAYGAPDDGAEPALRDVNFAATPGETVGIVGETGAGKSTLVKLLLRYYDVDEGSIRVDGHDVRDVTLQSLRDSIGYVSQEPHLFHGTVRENIAYGEPDATDRDVREAARVANAHEFIERLPEGYDTEVGERGAKLSGGQRQRIAIARAVVRDPAIMIFDEATSHVDNETEVLIQHSMAEITEDRTTFVIAHRLSTVRNADTILVFEDGEIAERGSHDELLEADGTYADLWSVQVGRVDSLPDDFLDGAAG